MFRRFLVIFVRRAFFVFLLVCLGCSAQPTPSAPPDVVHLVERQVRATYSVPTEVKVLIGPLQASEFQLRCAQYHFRRLGQKKDYEFLLARDQDAVAHDQDRPHAIPYAR